MAPQAEPRMHGGTTSGQFAGGKVASPDSSTRRRSLEPAASASSGHTVFFVRVMCVLFVPPRAHPHSCVPDILKNASPTCTHKGMLCIHVY